MRGEAVRLLFVSNAADLPDDIDALKAALREARATIADRDIVILEREERGEGRRRWKPETSRSSILRR